MIKFKDHIVKQHIDHFSRSDLNIERKDMPQIPQHNHENFVEYMKKNGVESNEKTVDPKTLKATQSNFHIDKIKSLLDVFDKQHKKVLVSKDNYVLDGHHSVLAQRIRDKGIDVIQFNCDIKRFLELANNYDKVEYRESAEL